MDFNKHIFKGKWITAEEFAEAKPSNVFHRQLEPKEIKSKMPRDSHILFRKHFELKKTDNTEIFISADDYYKLYINGRFVCQGPAPGYVFHYYYNKVDISEFVSEGDNVIAVHTYYQGLINRVWVSGDDRHGLILDIVQNGDTVLFSDESFLCSYHSGFDNIGTYGYDTQFAQKYISGTVHEGFYENEYCDLDWGNACLKKYADYKLFEQPTKMLEFETVRAEIKYEKSVITADFGGIYVGYLELEGVGRKGDTISLFFGQELEENGDVRWKLRANCEYREEWVLSGGHDKLCEFDYKSFRYVRIELPEGAEIKKIQLRARHYPFELIAKPCVQDSELLKIWDLCVNTLKYGAQEVIQDCMEREKGNYLGDGLYTALTYYILTDDASLLKKLIDDSLRSSFINKGLVTCACCSFMQEIAEYPLMMYYTLFEYCRLSGDKEYLAGKYDELCSVLDYYRKSYMRPGGLLCDLDKWCVAEWPKEYRDEYAAELCEGQICREVHNVINAHFIGAVKYMNKISCLLKRPIFCDEEPLISAFYKEFYDEDKKLFTDTAKSGHISLLSNIFPLMYGIYREKETEDAIITLIKEKGLTSVMLFGAFPILAGLKRLGKTELMYKMLKDKKAWLNMIAEGATRTFEGWGKDAKWNTSLFHLTLSYAAMFIGEGGKRHE